MPNIKYIDLSKYRLERAESSIIASKELIDAELFLDGINRSYYAIFHAIRAVLALESVDFKKHSAVISHFQKEYVKTGIFKPEISKYIIEAFRIRNESDYKDFYLVSKSDATEQLDHAMIIVAAVKEYTNKQYSTGL